MDELENPNYLKYQAQDATGLLSSPQLNQQGRIYGASKRRDRYVTVQAQVIKRLRNVGQDFLDPAVNLKQPKKSFVLLTKL